MSEKLTPTMQQYFEVKKKVCSPMFAKNTSLYLPGYNEADIRIFIDSGNRNAIAPVIHTPGTG